MIFASLADSKIKYAVSQKASDSAVNMDLATLFILLEFQATAHELLLLSDKKTIRPP